MSPTEDQLRRALSDGEGPGPDPDTVILRAAAYRSERRTKLFATAAVVAVVAGIGTAVGVVTTNSDHTNSANSNTFDKAAGPAGSGAASSEHVASPPLLAGGPGTVPAAAGQIAAIPCPDTFPSLPLTQDRTSAFFTTTVTGVVVCAYDNKNTALRYSGGPPAQLTLSGAAAAAVVDSIQKASQATDTVKCFAIPRTGVQHLVVVAEYATGEHAPPIDIMTGGCINDITNGHTSRQDWQPPTALADFVAKVAGATLSQSSSAPAKSFEPTPTR